MLMVLRVGSKTIVSQQRVWPLPTVRNCEQPENSVPYSGPDAAQEGKKRRFCENQAGTRPFRKDWKQDFQQL